METSINGSTGNSIVIKKMNNVFSYVTLIDKEGKEQFSIIVPSSRVRPIDIYLIYVNRAITVSLKCAAYPDRGQEIEMQHSNGGFLFDFYVNGMHIAEIKLDRNEVERYLNLPKRLGREADSTFDKLGF